MTRGRARRYLLVKQGYYPQVVADAGYSVWDWDASRLSTLFQDSAKTTPVTANSDPVGAWVDGVQGVDATQATTANKPTYTTASLNGLPTLSFDGGDFLATANISISTFAIWVVMNDVQFSTRLFYSHNAQMELTTTASNTITVARSAISDISSRLPGDWATGSNGHIVRHAHNGTHATHTMTLDGVLQTLTPVTTNDVGTGTATQPLYIGARSGGVAALLGNIAHLCIVSPYPTDASIIVNMESYINSKWSVY